MYSDICLAHMNHYSEKTGGSRYGFDMERAKCQGAKKLQLLKEN